MPESVRPQPDFSDVPRRVSRKAAAELVTKHFFPVSQRSVADWPLNWLVVNGYALCETADLFAAAQAKVDAAMAHRGEEPQASSADAGTARPHGVETGKLPALGCTV